MDNDTRQRTIGFIGLGAMGHPMALNILRAGQRLVVYDINPERGAPLEKLGARIADNPGEVARQAAVIVSMVDTIAQNESVLFGSDGLVNGTQAGDVAVIMSTMDPAAAQGLHERLAAHGVELIDAPVTGLIEGAEKGTLKAYVGGNAAALERARPALEPMTSEITHVGGIGQGCMLKLINNLLAQANRILVVEAMVLATKAGLEPQIVIDAVSKSTGNSAIFQHAAPRLLSRDFTGIRMDITIKDLELETKVAKSLGVPMFMASVAQQVYMMAKASGYGGEDPSAVVKVYEQLTGVSLARP